MSQSEVKKTLHELKVNELRNVLEKRGMDKTGIKAILIDRLDQVGTFFGNLLTLLVFRTACKVVCLLGHFECACLLKFYQNFHA